jgi:hypothetical protein
MKNLSFVKNSTALENAEAYEKKEQERKFVNIEMPCELIEKLKKTANENMRTIPKQALWILENYFNGGNK